MKKFTTLVLTSMSLAILLSTNVYASGLKVGVVNMKKLSAEAPQAKLINERLKEIIEEPKQELDELAKEIESLGKKIEKNELISSPGQVQKMKEEYQKKAITYKQKESALNRGIQTAQQRGSAVFGEAVIRSVNKIAKDEKYDLIVHESVLYSNKKLDITNKILKGLKKDFKKKQDEESNSTEKNKKK